MKLASLSLLLVLASIAVAETAKAPEKKVPELAPADVAKVEKFFNEFADAIVKNQDACPKMAGAVNSLITTNESWLTKLVQTGKDLPQSSKDKMQKRQGEMMGALMKCKDDKDVTAAFQRFVGIMAKKPAAKTEETAKPAEKTAPPPAKTEPTKPADTKAPAPTTTKK